MFGQSQIPRGLLEYTENMSIESREFGLEKAIIGIASEAPKEAAQLIERLNNNGAKDSHTASNCSETDSTRYSRGT